MTLLDGLSETVVSFRLLSSADIDLIPLRQAIRNPFHERAVRAPFQI